MRTQAQVTLEPKRSRASTAAARTVTVAVASSPVTTTSGVRSDDISSRSASTAARRSQVSGSCTVISANVSRLRIDELTIVSEASLSFGTTRRDPSAARMNVYVTPISSTTPSTPA